MSYSILKDLDIIFGQVLNKFAARIVSAKGDVHESDVNSDRFLPYALGEEANERGNGKNAGLDQNGEQSDKRIPISANTRESR